MRNRGQAAAEFAGISLLTAALLLLAWLGVALYPDELPDPSSPNFVDNIFDSRVVIWAARLLLVSAAFVLALGGVFIVASTVVRMKNGEWLKRAGPFEVSELAAGNLNGEIDFWRNMALAKQERLTKLHALLNNSDALLEQSRRDLRDDVR